MRHILTSVFLVVLLFPALALGSEVKCDELVMTDGFPCLKSFTGEGPSLVRSFKDGKRDGPWVSYYYNGQLKWKGNYKDGKVDGPFVSYWDNGKLQSQGTSKDGEMEGPWVSYNKDGTVNEKWTGTFRNGVKVK